LYLLVRCITLLSVTRTNGRCPIYILWIAYIRVLHPNRIAPLPGLFPKLGNSNGLFPRILALGTQAVNMGMAIGYFWMHPMTALGSAPQFWTSNPSLLRTLPDGLNLEKGLILYLCAIPFQLGPFQFRF